MLLDAQEANYFVAHYQGLSNRDVFTAFVEIGILLLSGGGYIGYIIPSSWQTGSGYLPLRKFVFTKSIPISVVVLPFDTFIDAYVDTGIYVLQKQPLIGMRLLQGLKNGYSMEVN
jgi:hypothetical protein